MELLKTLSGKVVPGTGNGKKIGFPTVNIAINDRSFDLPFGVYASRVFTKLGDYTGALHFGPRKVLNLMEPLLEVYLLDFSGDLYDEVVKVEVLDKVRDTMDFEDMDSLKKQIKKDVEMVRKMEDI